MQSKNCAYPARPLSEGIETIFTACLLTHIRSYVIYNDLIIYDIACMANKDTERAQAESSSM